MGERPLCVNPTCRGRDHLHDCADDGCRGCLPRPAADGLRLCLVHTERIGNDAIQAATLHGELVERLTGGMGAGEPVSGSSERTRVPNPRAVEMRATIRHVLVGWTKLIAEERGFSAPADEIDAIGRFVARAAQWLAATDYADEVSVELDDLVHAAKRVAYPSGTRAVDIAPCPTADCVGTVRAVLRPRDALLPSELVCDADGEHRWGATQWHAFARRTKGAAA